MLKNKLLADYKDELKNKFGYDEDFAQTIAITVESVIERLGNEYEQLVLDAVLSCKIVIARKEKVDENGKKVPICENVYDVLKRENMLDIYEGASVTAGELKRASGVYTSVPQISAKDGIYSIDDIRRIIVLTNSFNSQSPSSLANLSHEIMHLVKSYVKEYSIESNILTQRSGLMETTYFLSSDNGQVSKKMLSEKGVGFEEGINSYDEQAVVRENFDSEYSISGYNYQRITAGFIMDNLGLTEVIRNAQMTKNMYELCKIFETSGVDFDKFLEAVDTLNKKDYERYSYAFNPDKLRTSTEELESYFANDLAPLVRTLQHSLNSELGDKYVI